MINAIQLLPLLFAEMNSKQFQQSKREANVFNGINQAFINLGDLSAQVYDYWISELYTEDNDLDWGKWNEGTLRLMELDVFSIRTHMNTIERNQLQHQLVEQIIDSMDTRTLEQFAKDSLNDSFDKYSYEELLVEADDYGIEVDIPEEVEL